MVWKCNLETKKKLQSVVKKASKIIGQPLQTLQDTYKTRMVKRFKSIIEDEFHPGKDFFELLPSGKRLRSYCGNKRFINSFYPACVRLINESKTALL